MKIDRLIGILSILLQQEKVTAPYLAEKFEVSRRTIIRDVEALCKAGIPIVTAQGREGGISIMDGYRVDRTLLTSREMQSILTGLKSLDSVSGSNKYQQLMDKLSVKQGLILAADSHIDIDLSSFYKEALAPKIELILSAAEERRLIGFDPGRGTAENCAFRAHFPVVLLVRVGILPGPAGLPPVQATPRDPALRDRRDVFAPGLPALRPQP